MMTILETLTSYVPTLIARRLASNPARLTAPVVERFPAAILFADISGFTALTERLGQRGPTGVEDLSYILNIYFGQLINLVTARGGDIVKFAGDALLALWLAPDGDLSTATLQAAQCALEAQSALHNYISEGARLTMRVGVGAGEIFIVHIGGEHSRWEFLVTGEPLLHVSKAEQQAQPGQVVLAPDAWALVQAHCRGEALGGNGVRLSSLNVSPPRPSQRPELPLPPEAETALRAYIPSAVLARLAAGQGGWIAELRWISVLFINLPDLNYTTPIERAQTVMRELQKILYHYEGSINKLNVDDKGATLVAALGLPPLAHEDDAIRATHVALEMHHKLRQLDLQSAIGLTTGRVFCGSVGQTNRREYTMIGDTINLAARLMQAASVSKTESDLPILCDSATYEAAKPRIEFETLPAITVKGKAEPVVVYRPHRVAPSDRQTTVRTQTSLVGRATEQALLNESLHALQYQGESRVVIVEGEPGIGKSRLVEDVLLHARGVGITAWLGAGDAIEKSTPYHAWRSVFNQLFNLGAATDPATRREQVLAQLQADPAQARLAPLLNAALALDLPDNDLTAQMEGQVRADNTQRLLLSLIAQMPTTESPAVRPLPKVLVLEDAHWLDSASWALARRVSHEIPSLLLVLATRPMEEPLPTEYHQLLNAPGTQRLRLEPLSAEDALTLVCWRLGVATLPQAVQTLIIEKAEGHPFFSEEIAYALRDAGLILIRDGNCQIASEAGDLKTINLPNTVEGMITSRIDRLTPPHQLTLKVASVIGRVFAFHILKGIHPIEEDKPHLPEYLDLLQRLDITPLESPEPELAYIFKHIITREVTYTLMLFAQRRQLHRAVAEWYERTQADELASHYPLLAYHWAMAEVTVKATEYLGKAGEQALRNGAYREAVKMLSEAVTLDARLQTPSEPLRRARWARQMGEAYLGLGELPEGRAHFERAVALLGWAMPAGQGRLALTLIGQMLRQTWHRLWPERFLGRGQLQRDTLLEAARAYERHAEICYFTHETLLLLNGAFHTLNLAESAGPSPELARAYANMCVTAGLIPLHRLARAYERRALETAASLEQSPPRALAFSRAGLYNTGTGQWAKARELLQSAIEIADQIRNERQWGESSSILGLVTYFQGEFVLSCQMFAGVYARARRNGNVQFQAWGLWGQSYNLLRLGRLDEAVMALQTGVELLTKLNDHSSEITITGLLASAYLYQGQLSLARTAADAVARSYEKPSAQYSLAEFEGHAGAAETFLWLWELARHSGPPNAQEVSDLRTLARKACRAVRSYARVYPIGRPRAHRLQGLSLWLAGELRSAQQAWLASLRIAEQLGMPYECGRAHDEIGRHLEMSDPARPRHLTEAGVIFARLGAAYDEIRVMAALESRQISGQFNPLPGGK